MSISKTILNIRFGYGISPNEKAFDTIDEILADLQKPNKLHQKFTRLPFIKRLQLFEELRESRKQERNNKSKNNKKSQALQKKLKKITEQDVRAFILQAVLAKNGFRERLVAFWHDNFTVSSKNLELSLANGAYIEEAIRPNIVGKFSDLLKSAIIHPAMLLYLDQYRSIGENSKIGKKRKRGINENLAREILELHTMGVGASYTQTDVRQFAKLLTGLTIGKKGFYFEPSISEPGKKKILGKVYGSNNPKLAHIMQFLDDLAIHPETANHIAKKLAVHFVSENPSDNLVNHIKQAFMSSDGDLIATYRALLEHKDSARTVGEKVKWPLEYVVSVIRALSLASELEKASLKQLRRLHFAMVNMGQFLFRPSGPDGWSEKATHWINPPSLAARINWAGDMAFEYGQQIDPRILVKELLGEFVSEELLHAVGDSESKWEGVALLLVSAQFNRR